MVELKDITRRARTWACYDCGKCTATCPLARVGGGLSPRRSVLAANLGDRSALLVDGSLRACLTCSQCDQRCPVEVDYTSMVRELREFTHHGPSEPDCPHGGALQSVMRMMARGGTTQNRLEWLGGDLATEPAQGEVFYWTGCGVYYDAFFKDLGVEAVSGLRAAVRLMNRLGVKPVVSAEERCCGHDLLWNGDRASFELLARHNTALVAASGAQWLVTSCAECLRTWKVDYAPFLSRPLKVLHITEFVAEHLPELKLKPDGEKRVTFQDPCRMGRHLGLYEPPRRILRELPGVEFKEMRRAGAAAVCCAGGTWSNCDRYAKQVQVERLREARSTGAQVLVTACPKCQIHFRCAMRDPKLGAEIEIEVRDVAELVAERLEPA